MHIDVSLKEGKHDQVVEYVAASEGGCMVKKSSVRICLESL